LGILQKVIIVGGSVSAFDALHEIRLVAQHPVISSLKEPIPAFGWNAFTHPHVAIKSPISKFCPEGKIDFRDGSSVDDIDIVLFATGYDYSFPFLPGANSRVRNRRIQGLYQHVFDIEDPTLAFIGMVSCGAFPNAICGHEDDKANPCVLSGLGRSDVPCVRMASCCSSSATGSTCKTAFTTADARV
jgi:hypothetical protein